MIQQLSANQPESDRQSAKTRSDVVPRRDGGPVFVLIVDDDADYREGLADALEVMGYRTTIAGGWDAALAAVEEESFHVALIDMRLGSHSGIELIGRLYELRPELQCVIMTGYASMQNAVEALRLGAVDYLSKPVDMRQVEIALERIVERRALIHARASAERALHDRTAELDTLSTAQAKIIGAASSLVGCHDADELGRGLLSALSGIIVSSGGSVYGGFAGTLRLIDRFGTCDAPPERQPPGGKARVVADGAELVLPIRAQSDGQTVEVVLLLYSAPSRPMTEMDLRVAELLAGYGEALLRTVCATETLRLSEQRFANVLEMAPDAIISFDEQRRVLMFNRGAERAFGFSSEEVIGEPIESLLPGGSTAQENSEMQGVHKNGEQFPVEASVSKVSTGDQQIFTAIVRDVSARRAAEAELAERTEQFRRAQRLEAVGRLAGGVAHDFNNLLTAIQACVSMLDKGLAREPRLREYAIEIGEASDRAASLTRQLLAFSRRQVLEPVVTSFGAIAADAEKILRRIIGEDIEFVVDTRASRQPILADIGQIEQIITNLAVNARDAMPHGGRLMLRTDERRIGADNDHELPAGAYACLDVTDTGIGMDDETLARIFEPFFTTKDVERGTGLGLATVHGIVKQSGGAVIVHSQPMAGTTVTVMLPVHQGAGSPQPTRRAQRMPVSHRSARTILFAEDEVLLQKSLGRVLRGAGYTVLHANNGDAALAVAASGEHQIDLLITDLVMPKMGGPELARALRAIHPNLPVLFISGYSNSWVGETGQAAKLLQKPFLPEDLLNAIDDVLSEAR